jgi:hypothetical protein
MASELVIASKWFGARLTARAATGSPSTDTSCGDECERQQIHDERTDYPARFTRVAEDRERHDGEDS